MIKKNNIKKYEKYVRIPFKQIPCTLQTSIYSFSLAKEFEIESIILIYHACELVFSFLMHPHFYCSIFSNWVNLASKAPRVFWMSLICFVCSSNMTCFLLTFSAFALRHFLTPNMVNQAPSVTSSITKKHIPTETNIALWTKFWLNSSRLSLSTRSSSTRALRCSVMVLFNTFI